MGTAAGVDKRSLRNIRRTTTRTTHSLGVLANTGACSPSLTCDMRHTMHTADGCHHHRYATSETGGVCGTASTNARPAKLFVTRTTVPTATASRHSSATPAACRPPPRSSRSQRRLPTYCMCTQERNRRRSAMGSGEEWKRLHRHRQRRAHAEVKDRYATARATLMAPSQPHQLLDMQSASMT
jgi:hypothetical protein